MKNLRITWFILALLFCSIYSVKAQNCTLPVIGGTATSAQLTSCPSMSFNISVTGGSTGTGLSYQWESSPDNTNWTVMPGITTSNLFTPQTATTWYRRKTICDAGGSAYSSSIQITANNFLTCYCTPSHSNCATYSITNVNFGSINNTSTCGTNGYTDYSATVAAANVMQGAFMPISIAVTNATNALFIDCYIDYNQNGLFDGKEHTLIFPPVGNVYNGFIKVPFTAKTGLTRMRISYNLGSSNACYPTPFSETEDYHINITPNTTAATGHVIYVKATAPGSNSLGNTWTNATTSLRDALAKATPGDTIKMASGIYYSGTTQSEGVFLQDSVFIFGGYPNTGSPTNADRNFSIHQTILSGQKSSTDPAADFHVLAAKRIRACTVDGVIIQNGGSSYGTIDQMRGAGVFMENSAAISFRNCVFRANTNNEVFSEGSAFYMHNSTASFTNCIVAGNNSYNSTMSLQANSHANFTNLLAARNGGGYLVNADSSSIVFRNSTIAANKSTAGVVSAANQTQVSFVNSITYYNSVFNLSWQSTNYDSSEVDLFNSTASFQHSLMQVANNGTNLLLGVSPKFKDTGSVAGPDGFYFTADDGFTLNNPCSPALNAGSNSDAAGITTDIAGLPRIFGAQVDLGAYELQQAPGAIPKVIYVNPAATGANNGTSWANAFTDLHKALQLCSDTIKMAAGTYQPWKSSINPSYYQVEGRRVILGAYPATGNPTNADRNYQLHLTKIDGLLASGGKAINVLRGRNLDSTSILDGLVFTNTGAEMSTFDGAVVYVECNNPVISNCSFTGNVRRVFWGKNNKNPLFDHCRVYNNTGIGNSYSLDWIVLTNSRQTTFRGCTFEDNRLPTYTGISGEFGKVLDLQNTDAVIDSCRFIKNRGTALANTHSTPTVTNSFFLNNYADDWTTDVYNRFSDPVFDKCVFQDSAWGFHAQVRYGGIMNNYLSKPVFTNCRFINGKAAVGGVAYNDSSNAKFTNCVFLNSSNAFYNINSSNIELTNCISDRSVATNGPSFMHNVRSSPVLKNCVVVNSTSGMKAVMRNEAGSNPQIYNAVFWKNFIYDVIVPQDGTRIEIENLGNSQPQIQHSMFEVYNAGSAGNNTTGVDPRFKNYLDPDGPDNTWFTADDGLQLCDCSPAINSGNNALIAQQPTDVAGLARIFGNTVDRGAYELQFAPVAISKTSYVNASASAGGDGSGWANAYTQLHAALNNACTDTIKMAAGIYKPAIQNRDSGFSITRNLVLLGSYNAPGNTRDVDAHATIISGEIGNVNDTADNSLGLMKSFYADSLIIDGIVLQGANQNMAGPSGFGGALKVEYSKYFSLANSRFYNNYSKISSSGLFLTQVQKFELEKTVFSGNKAINGAGVYVGGAGAGSKMLNCVFDSNEAYADGGGVWNRESGISFINCVFSRNKAMRGAGMLLDNNPDVAVINCTFTDNRPINGGNEGCGIYSSGFAWTGGGLGPEIGNCVFTGNGPSGMNQGLFQDIYYPKNGYPPNSALDIRIHHTASSTGPIYYWGGGMIHPGSIVYKNRLNPIGPDGKWFTADDGLQLSVCSNGIDDGSNAIVSVPQDLAGNARIFNSTVDMGAYEFNGNPEWSQLLNVANTSLTANKEVTDTLGWTHYYKDCQYLMSIKKAGQNIGTVGDGTFELKVSTGAGYQSGAGRDLTSAAYHTSGLAWHAMHRYWNITSTNAVQDSILIRFPYDNTDMNDLRGSNASLSQHSQLEFFKVNGANDPFNLSIAAADFFRYTHAATPSKTTWTYSQQDSVHLAEYYVQSFNAGGGGAQFNNTLPDLVVSSATVSPGSIGSGGTVTVSFTEGNVTPIRAAGPHKVYFYLSADNVLTTGDVLLTTYDIASLNASSNTGVLTQPVTIPCATFAGNYFLLVVADGNSTVAETNEWNNEAFVPLTVSARPAMNFTASATTICHGSSVNLSATGATTYAWTGEGLSATTGNAVTATPTSLGSLRYTVIGTVNGCLDTAILNINVNANPVVTVSRADTTLCSGTSFTLTASGATTYAWSPATGLNTTSGAVVIASPVATTTYTVTGTTNGCSATATRTVNVRAVVTPAVTVDVTGCPGDDLTFTANPVNGGSSPEFEWYVNNVKQGTGLNFTLNDAKNDMQVYVKMIGNAACASVPSVNSPIIDINCIITPNPPVNGVEFFAITPNPSDGLINIQMKTQGAKSVSFKLMDANGHVVHTRQPIQVNGTYVTQIDIRGRGQGMYYLLTTVDNESFVRAIMIVR